MRRTGTREEAQCGEMRGARGFRALHLRTRPSFPHTISVRNAVLVCLLLLNAIGISDAQAVVRLDSAATARGAWSGTWSAGTWTLADAQAKTVAFGGWSAVKSADRWAGAWRANVTGRAGEFSGTWTSSVDLKATARFVDMFEKAAQTIVSGAWTTGGKSGGWSIRAAK